MPQLIVDDVPREIYARLEKRAAAGRRSVSDETLLLLEHVLVEATEPRSLEYIPDEAIPAPYDLPRMSTPEIVEAIPATYPRLPDFLCDEAEVQE